MSSTRSSVATMALEKYGVENRKDLIEEELKSVQGKLATKEASEKDYEYLTQREEDLKEALKSLA